MKILVVYKASGLSDNPFVRILAEGVRRCGVEVTCSVEEFWRHADRYDLVHLQWPEEAFGWRYPDDEKLEAFGRRLRLLREKGISIVYTRHNAQPHKGDANLDEAYRLTETLADAVIHLGECSRRELAASDPETKRLHVVIPHHIYEGIYNYTLDKETARRQLGIPAGSFVILAFGAFRHTEERRLAWGAFRRLDCREKFLLAPRLWPYTLLRGKHWDLKRLVSAALFGAARLAEGFLHCRITSKEELVPDDLLPACFAAADVVLIQRQGILNSGNVPMAYAFGRVAAGPGQGNIGELLEAAGNPVFDPADPASVDRAVLEAARLTAAGQGERNRAYAHENLALDRIAALHCDLYRQLHDDTRR